MNVVVALREHFVAVAEITHQISRQAAGIAFDGCRETLPDDILGESGGFAPGLKQRVTGSRLGSRLNPDVSDLVEYSAGFARGGSRLQMVTGEFCIAGRFKVIQEGLPAALFTQLPQPALAGQCGYCEVGVGP
ncbi:MAG: hypothetical protein ACFHXK_13700 [bacterium]